MIQTWNKFCFTTGYIEVAVTFPGPNENTRGYVSLHSLRFGNGRGFGAVKAVAEVVPGGTVSILFVGDPTYTTPVSFLSHSRSRSFCQ